MINQYGGKIKDAIGVPEDQLRQAARSAVCKINIDSDGRLVMTATIRKVFAEPRRVRPAQVPGPGPDGPRGDVQAEEPRGARLGRTLRPGVRRAARARFRSMPAKTSRCSGQMPYQ